VVEALGANGWAVVVVEVLGANGWVAVVEALGANGTRAELMVEDTAVFGLRCGFDSDVPGFPSAKLFHVGRIRGGGSAGIVEPGLF